MIFVSWSGCESGCGNWLLAKVSVKVVCGKYNSCKSTN